MSIEVDAFVQETEKKTIPLYKALTLAMWKAATTGSPEANERQKQAQVEMMRFWSDPERFATVKQLHESGAAENALQARTIKRLYLAASKAQQDEETIERVTELEAEVRGHYYNFRPEVDGTRLSDNQLDDVIHTSHDTGAVRSAWLASKEVGELVAEQVRELARLRNAAAQAQGYRDHFERMLTLNEIGEDDLLKTFAHLEQATDKPFAKLKAQIDANRAEQFRVHMRREVGGIVGRKEAGQWMKERIIKSGAAEVWSQHVVSATGEALNPDYFIRSMS